MDTGLAATLNGIETTLKIRRCHYDFRYLPHYLFRQESSPREGGCIVPLAHMKPIIERELISAVQDTLCQADREPDPDR